MHEAERVSGGQRPGDLSAASCDGAGGQRAARQPRAQGLTGHVFERQVSRALVLASRVDRYDVGVSQSRQSLARARLRRLVPELEGQRAIEARIARPIDGSLGAAAELRHDLEAGEDVAGAQLPHGASFARARRGVKHHGP